MPKPSAARKVTRVARTGGGRTKRGQSSWFFPTLIVVTALAGTFLIAFSRAERQPDTSRPRIGSDHWHAAIGFDICGTFAAPVPDNGQDPLGIHTHGDGIVHVHPFSSQSAGKNAILKVWFDTVGAKVTSTQIKLPNDEVTHKNGQKCGDKTANVITKVWDTRAPDDQGHIVADPDAIKLKDQMLITVAFVPDGDPIPKPPSESQLDNLNDVGANATSTTVPATSTTVAGATTTLPPTTTPTPTSAP